MEWPRELTHIYVISIRNARLQQYMKRMAPLIRFVHGVVGVNGNTLDVNMLIQERVYRPLNQYNSMTRGELGCFLSHRAIWLKAVEAKLPYTVIMEDDCNFVPTPKAIAHLTQCLARLRVGDPAWEILFLGRNPQFQRNTSRVSKHLVRPGRSWGLFFYVVSFAGAKSLLRQSTTIRKAADIFVSTCPSKHRYALTPSACFVTPQRSDTLHIK